MCLGACPQFEYPDTCQESSTCFGGKLCHLQAFSALVLFIDTDWFAD